MATNFGDLKKNKASKFDSLVKESEKLNEKVSYVDERIWKCERDKNGNGYAIIRFLPECKGESGEYVTMFTHGFKGPGGWYIENCLTTPVAGSPKGFTDPVSKSNTALWNSGIESDKAIARDRKRKQNFYSNILVIEDSNNKDNEGKVFLFRYGKKIFDKTQQVLKPEFADEVGFNPFDFWDGANFKIKIRQVDGYANYDKSEFCEPTALFDGDETKIKAVWESQYSLDDLIAPDKFKSYQELEARFKTVIGSHNSDYSETIEEEIAEPVSAAAAGATTFETASEPNDSETMDYFKKLADQ
jgi:hypothetical protein